MEKSLTIGQLRSLRFLVETLDANQIPFLVIGGLAAIAWGAPRGLADVDIQIKKADFNTARLLFAEYIKTDIRHYVTERWDIKQMVLNIHGVGVDICQAEEFHVVVDGKKHLVPDAVLGAAKLQVDGVDLPVQPLEDLVKYKKLIRREVDLQDLALLGIRF